MREAHGDSTRGEVKARREWAAKLIADDTFTVSLDHDNVQVVGKNAAEDHLRKEHARVVRIVKARDKWLLDGGYDNMGPDFQAGYHQACNDLLAALTKGRA